MRGIKLLLLPLAVALMTVVSSSAAWAGLITYSETAIISGSLDGVGFNGETIVISWTGDTANVVNEGGGFFRNTAGSNAVAFSITNVGSGIFTDNMFVYDNQTFIPTAAAGFGSFTQGGSIIATFDNVFAAYDLTTAIGPITNDAFIRPDLTFGTNAGGLNIQAVREVSTFEASVPEPAMLSLLGLGLAGALRARKRAR
jgi:hypothetical protein